MSRRAVDVFISGAGPAGLIAAAALGATGASVLVADPGPDPARAGGRVDLRSTAVLRPARALFARLGLWPRLEAGATPLEALRIVDLAGDPPAIRAERTFAGTGGGTGDDPGGGPEGEPLGWNFMNDTLRTALVEHVLSLPNVALLWGTGFAGLVNRTAEALIDLTGGERLAVRLAVAADGRESPLREAAGIAARTIRYGQKALAFAAAHERPHRNVSTELYLEGGPFTVVPLPDHGGGPASAVVWMNPGARAVALAGLDDAAFAAEATRRSAGLLGAMRPLTRRAVWPVVTRRAERLVAGRVALVAEAAHVLPPIGAQGLNTSVGDIARLARGLEGAADPGDAAMLAGYARDRGADIAARAAAIDLFNRVTRAADPLSQGLRRWGLALAHDLPVLRAGLIRAGMGPDAPAGGRAEFRTRRG